MTALKKGTSWPHWVSPVEVRQCVAKMGRVALDPCSNPASKMGAVVEWFGPRPLLRKELPSTAEAFADPLRRVSWTDGLATSWQGFDGLTYVNPPYGRGVGKWLRKCADEAALGAEVIALVAASTGTRWCHDHVFKRAQALCFVDGRLQFENEPPSGKSVSTLENLIVFWGDRRSLFIDSFKSLGWCPPVWAPRPVCMPREMPRFEVA
jgi:hypothetical protein